MPLFKNFLSNIRNFTLLFRQLFKIDFTLELLENELNRLLKDKETIVKTIAQMELELENLNNKSFMLDGAIQTCSFFVESEKEDNKKADRLKKNKKPLMVPSES